MKYFLAFALVAVAAAVSPPSPVRLMEPVLFKEPMPVKVVDAPEISEAAVEDVNDYAVKFVDEAVNADAATVADLKSLLEPVLLEEAVYAPLTMPEEAEDAVMAVKVVEASEVSDASEDINAYAIKIVEEAVNDAEGPLVNFVHAPLPDSFVLPLDATVALPSIEPVFVEVDEESPGYVPQALRRYPDATWR